MKRSIVFRSKELFPGSDTVRKYTFKMMGARDNCALLAKANHRLAHDFAIEGVTMPIFTNKIVLNACHRIK